MNKTTPTSSKKGQTKKNKKPTKLNAKTYPKILKNWQKPYTLKYTKRTTLASADHPLRQSAIQIIEEILERELKKGLQGTKYYDIEDEIVEIIYKTLKRQHAKIIPTH